MLCQPVLRFTHFYLKGRNLVLPLGVDIKTSTVQEAVTLSTKVLILTRGPQTQDRCEQTLVGISIDKNKNKTNRRAWLLFCAARSCPWPPCNGSIRLINVSVFHIVS